MGSMETIIPELLRAAIWHYTRDESDCPDTVDPLECDLSTNDLWFWNHPCVGQQYLMDNKKVWNILKGLLVESEAWTWIQAPDKKED
eukprot:scaffold87776_cov71-Attheya_sp.AAC.1